MDVSIIIVNYNTKQLTCQCIDSIYEKTNGVSFEIIVVDNNSTDGSQELLSHDSRIVFVEAGENLGFGKANNLGVGKSKGKYIFFLNSDTILVNNAIKDLYDYSIHHKQLKLGAVGCLLENPNGAKVHSYGFFPSKVSLLTNSIKAGLRLIFHKARQPVGYSVDGKEQIVDYVTGADVFVERTVIDNYGGFDPDFFMYYEDTEMQYRWWSHGLVNMIITSPRIIHLEGCSTNDNKKILNERKLYMCMRSQQLYFKKTETSFGYYIYRILSFISLLPILRGKYNLHQIINICKILFCRN